MEKVKKMINSLCSKISYIFHFLKKRINIKINANSVLEHIIVLELYTLLTILAFRKLFILGIDNYVIGDHGDAWQFIWNFWWVKKAILEGRNIFYTDYLFYPNGAYLYFHTLNLTAILMVFPLMLFIDNLKIIYNISVLLAFILSGYFMYLFLNYFLDKKGKDVGLTKKFVSFLGGCMYAFSPYVVSKALGYFNLLSVEWVPLALLVTLKTLENATLKRMILVSFLLIVLFFTDFHYFYYYFFIVSFFLLFNFKKIKLKNFLFFGSSILISLTVLFIIYLPGIHSYLNENQSYVRNYFQTITWYNFFLPSPFTMIYKFFPQDVIRLYAASPVYMIVDSVVYYGISFTFLTILFLFLCIKEKINTNEIHFLIALFLFSSFLALGSSTLPSLTLNNILRKVLPFFDLLAVPARHTFLAFFSLILINTFLIYKILKKWRSSEFYFPFLFLLFFILLLEYFPINYNYYFIVKVPSTIYEISTMAGNFTILNIPSYANTQGMYFQTIHGKNILDGHVSRISQESLRSLTKINIMIEEGEITKLVNVIKSLNLKFIIVNNNYDHKSIYLSDDFSLLELLKHYHKAERIWSGERIEIYEVRT
jgi:hypothetical protein